MKKYKDCHQHQQSFLPLNLEDMIEKTHLVRIVDKFVSTLSPAVWDNAFSGGGAPSYHPQMMLKVILYAYSCQVYSCRQIARALRQDITFMWLTGMERIDFTTINRFRTDYFKDILEDVFTQLLDFLKEKKYISFTDFFVDGTKIEANANRHTHVWKKNTERYKAAVQERVKQLFLDIDELNAAEDKKYGTKDLPERGKDSDVTLDEIKEVSHSLSEKLKAITSKQQKRVIQSKIKKLKKESEKLKKYEKQEQILNGRNSYSKTDIGATFMRMKDGRLLPTYNAEISVENKFITNYSISNNAADSTTFRPHVEKIKKRGKKYLPKNYNGDSAYGSEENYRILQDENINNYLKFNNFHVEDKLKKKYPYHHENFIYQKADDTFKCPQGKQLKYKQTIERESKTGYKSKVWVYECDDCASCPFKSECTKGKGNRQLHFNPTFDYFKDQARTNLNSEAGRELRRRRGFEVETPFGDMKFNRKILRFSLRGDKKVEHEFGLHCIGYNLRKLSRIEMKKEA